jgi:anti-sigma factor ChrR (cupin superfamily)
MLTCREVTQLIASGERETAPWTRRLLVRVHLAMCDGCRRYARELDALGASARALWKPTPADDVAVRRVEEAIRAEIRRTDGRPQG